MNKIILTLTALSGAFLAQNSYAGNLGSLPPTNSGGGSSGGAYLSVDGGAFLVDDIDFNFGSAGGVPFGGKFEFDSGLAANVAAGYRFASGLSLELQSGFYKSDFNSNFDVDGLNSLLSIDGSVEMIPVLANVKFDIPLSSVISLELGAGVGGAYSQVDGVGTITGLGSIATSTKEWELIYQGMAGLNFKLSDNIDLKAGYRFIGVGDSSENFSGDDFKAHYFGGGLNIRF